MCVPTVFQHSFVIIVNIVSVTIQLLTARCNINHIIMIVSNAFAGDRRGDGGILGDSEETVGSKVARTGGALRQPEVLDGERARGDAWRSGSDEDLLAAERRPD